MVASIYCRATFIVLLAVLVTGCAQQVGQKAINSGNLDLGERQARAAAQKGHPVGFNNLGVIAQRRGNHDLALQMFTTAARMGDPTARMNLINLGAPVPAADLAQQDAGADGWQLLAAGMSGYAHGRYAAPVHQPNSTPPRQAPASIYPRPPPAPALLLPYPQCTDQTITENGKTRRVRVCQ
ncbi:MAG: hypothetical protein V4633_17710 [Pseudomonadota bacterium]